jgi:NTE family protein
VVKNALVLGGGGIAGIAWITGLLTGLAEAGQHVAAVDEIIGTSAGSTVAAQLGSGLGLEQLYARQTEPALQAAELEADVDLASFGAQFAPALAEATTYAEIRRAVGRYALGASPISESARLAVIESRLPSLEWPVAPCLKLVAVDAESGEPCVFTADCGVRLRDAVAASCAVPGVWPPVSIDGRRYVDGAVRSNTSADLVTGASRILVIAPLARVELFPCELDLDTALANLRTGGAEVAYVEPDPASLTAIGPNPANPATRGPAASAGRDQGRRTELIWLR